MTSNSGKKPQRGLTEVASQFIGWYNEPKGMRAFRYATSNPCRVPKGTLCLTATKPAILEVSSDQRSSGNGWLPLSDAYGIC